MSFKHFIFYCALCGGWAALVAWAICNFTALLDYADLESSWSVAVRSGIIAAIVGLLLGSVIGALDALLNAVGFQRVLRVLVCVVIAIIGSFIFGLVGELINIHIFKTGFPGRTPGWTLVGVVIGASIGIYDIGRAMLAGGGMRQAVKKTINGVIGGAVGGFVGGLFNDVLNLIDLKSKLPYFSVSTGLVILGLCIGLLIALAQVFLKEAWVRVEQGFRAGREMILSKPDTTIGRAEKCDIGLFGDNQVERLHAHIVLRGNRYVLLDENSPHGTWLNGQKINGPALLKSGDMIGVGKNMLRFEEKAKR